MLSEETRVRLEKWHRVQIMGIDMDILFTVFLSYYITTNYRRNFYQVLISVLLISIIVHRLFRINTRINQMIFGKV